MKRIVDMKWFAYEKAIEDPKTLYLIRLFWRQRNRYFRPPPHSPKSTLFPLFPPYLPLLVPLHFFLSFYFFLPQNSTWALVGLAVKLLYIITHIPIS